MAEPTKLGQQALDLVSAYDERTRLFNRLRDLRLDDEHLVNVMKEYATAADHFEKLRGEITRKKGG